MKTILFLPVSTWLKISSLLIIVVWFGCKQDVGYTQVEQAAQTLYDSLRIQDTLNKKIVVIVPLDGCSPCIEPCIAEIETGSLKNTQWILSSAFGKRHIVSKVGSSVIKETGVFLDKKGIALQGGLVTGSPVALFYNKSGTIETHGVITYQTADSIITEMYQWEATFER